MKIRFGYVAIAMDLKDCSPSKTVTVNNLQKIDDRDVQISKVRRLARENLRNTLRILKYNAAHQIHLYRFTSKLVPLATHPLLGGWDYVGDLSEELRETGLYVREHKMRVSAHPDHFTVINTPDPEIFRASEKDLRYHHNLLTCMNLDYETKLVLHIGGVYKDKQASMQRFIDNFKLLAPEIRKRIVLENDDKSYNASDVLEVCRKLEIPMVFDLHHHSCCNNGAGISDILPAVFDTWKDESLPPKVHISSPKSTAPKEFRMHAEYVESGEFLDFLMKTRELNRDFDVMVEAKAKNMALHKLLQDLSQVTEIKFIDNATIEI